MLIIQADIKTKNKPTKNINSIIPAIVSRVFIVVTKDVKSDEINFNPNLLVTIDKSQQIKSSNTIATIKIIVKIKKQEFIRNPPLKRKM